jgi:hypothetical protein
MGTNYAITVSGEVQLVDNDLRELRMRQPTQED